MDISLQPSLTKNTVSCYFQSDAASTRRIQRFIKLKAATVNKLSSFLLKFYISAVYTK